MPDTTATNDTVIDIDDTPVTESRRRKTTRVRRWPSPRALASTAALFSVAATGIAATALYETLHTPAYSAQQVEQAKTHVCAVFSIVRQGVVTNTHLANPTPGNSAGQLAVAANARLALLGGGAFLHDRLRSEPATPPDLADATNGLADTVEELGATYLAGSNTPLAPLRHRLDSGITQLKRLCGF